MELPEAAKSFEPPRASVKCTTELERISWETLHQNDLKHILEKKQHIFPTNQLSSLIHIYLLRGLLETLLLGGSKHLLRMYLDPSKYPRKWVQSSRTCLSFQ